MPTDKGYFGKEVILDLHSCDVTKFTRRSLQQYFDELCKLIDMVQCECHFWDDLDTPPGEEMTEPHTKGTSAVQFIVTSNITVHTLDILGHVYVNIFSCKDFDSEVAVNFTKKFFDGIVVNLHIMDRV
jgi:S-adenosylmethionine/arginine decarboxylase-like enzyme